MMTTYGPLQINTKCVHCKEQFIWFTDLLKIPMCPNCYSHLYKHGFGSILKEYKRTVMSGKEFKELASK